jgi:chromosome segregation ATPase
MEEHIHREGEALAGSNRIISKRNEGLRQETFAARRFRQTTEELQANLREVITARDRYRQELHGGPALDAALRQQLDAMHVRLQNSEDGQRIMAQANDRHRAESSNYAAQLQEARQLLDHSEKNANILDRTSKIQAGELAAMGMAENRYKTELRDYREALDSNAAAARDQIAAVTEKYQQLRKRYGKLKDAYQEWGEEWKSDDEVSYRTPPSVASYDMRGLGDPTSIAKRRAFCFTLSSWRW